MRYINQAADASPDEVVIGEGDYHPEWVWDEASGKLRPPSGAEWLATAKDEKVAELRRAFSSECERDFGSVWLVIADTANVAVLRTKVTRLKDLEARVSAAATQTGVLAVVW